MRLAPRVTLAAALLVAQCASAASWSKIRYRGGTVPAKVNPYEFNTTLTVEPDSIALAFAHSITVRFKPSQVISLSLGQEAHRRVAELARSIVPEPPGLFGLLRGTKEHLIGIVYKTDDGKTGAVLLEPDRHFELAILDRLRVVTGKPVETAP